jgi:hypothetical protein
MPSFHGLPVKFVKINEMKILFLVKLTSEYGSIVQASKSGLRNSAKFVIDAINKFDGVFAELDFCIDGNDIDRKLYLHKPDICIIEAIWITPTKLQEIIDLYPTVKFITRVHSKTPFIAMEGMAIEWLKAYEQISIISFNHIDTSRDFAQLGIKNTYLPNIYPAVEYSATTNLSKKYLYKIGCFGSIRPFKNQLNQAVAAILFADNRGSIVHFYINSTRIEQNGNTVLKGLKALFTGTRHKLIESDWLDHSKFLNLIAQMDACMQVSFTETFNIVTADCISQRVPIVVSDEIDWLGCSKVDPNNADEIAAQLSYVIDNKAEVVEDNINDLNIYNQLAILTWFKYLMR